MKIKFDMSGAQVNFAGAIDRMGKLTGIDRKKIVFAEAGSVLKKSFAETPKAPSQATLTLGARLRALRALKLTGGGPVSITAGLKGATYGRVFLRKKNGDGYRRTHDGNFHPLNQHYSDKDWALLRAAINDAKIVIRKVTPEVKASAGLARQSWVLIADSLGIQLESVPGGGASSGAISSARSARARGNKQARNGTSRIDQDAQKFLVTLINRLPYGNRLNFQNILTAAVAGRAKYMQTALAKGFLASAEDVARLFPGWTVKATGN